VPTIVKAKKDEPNISIIRRFKKQVAQDKVIPDARRKDFHKKPSVLKKERKKEWERQKRRNKRIASL
jgi:ribosomal protein S21